MQDRINADREQEGEKWPQTIRLYDRDAYLRTCTAVVLAVSERTDELLQERTDGKTVRFSVILDQTVFFPEGGGQSSDTGTLEIAHRYAEETVSDKVSEGGAGEGAASDAAQRTKAGLYPVTDVQLRGGVITHTVEVQLSEKCTEYERNRAAERFLAAFRPGTEVIAGIDFPRRFEFMQNHTGEHILSGLFHSRYGFDNIGFHLNDNTVTLDVNGHLTDAQIYEIEREANTKVWANLPVQVSYPTPQELETISYRSKIEIEGQIRIVTIPGVDVCACCAPHVARTGETGLIKIVKILRYKGGMRLWILCGGRAMKEMQRRQIQVEGVSHLTNRSQDQIADGVQYLLDEIAGLRQRIRELEYREAYAQLDRIPADKKNVFLFVGEMDSIVQRNLVNKLVEGHSGICGVFALASSASDHRAQKAEYYKYILGSRESDTRELNGILRGKFGARGGGRPEMVQGSVCADEAALREILPEE